MLGIQHVVQSALKQLDLPQLWRFAEMDSFGGIVERESSWSTGILKDADVRGLRRALIVTELPLEGDAVIA